MRSKVVRMLALALLLCGAGMVLAQSSPSGGRKPPENKKTQGANAPRSGEKSKLEEMLAEALKNNPDIRVAAANVALAEAELNRTRLQVTQKVLTLHHAILSQQALVNYEQKQYERFQGLLKDRAIDEKLLEERFAKLAAAKAKLAELEAERSGLLGKSASKEMEPGRLDLKDTQTDRHAAERYMEFLQRLAQLNKPAGPLAERMRKALQTPVKVDYKDMTFDAIFKDLTKKVPGLSFHSRVNLGGDEKVNLRFEEALPVSAVLQALADDGFVSFYVREYGILATTEKAVPPGAMTVEQFLRQKPATQPRQQSSGSKNPPAENVEGKVKAVDASGLMTISIGSDAGLAKGHTLELFRLNPKSQSQSKYLGTVRILETEAKQAVAQPVGRLTDKPQVGDRVASRLLGK